MPENRTTARYAVQRTLGEGGLGKTLLAHDRVQGGRPVALKLLRPEVSPSRLRREFEILRSLYHPHIVEVIEWGIFEDEKTPCLVMEYVEGKPLDEAIPSLSKKESWRPIAELCRALSYLHAEEVVHGDLKPSNILVPPKGPLKIIDFGLATFRKKEIPTASGTLAYMAPEVIRKGLPTPRSDLYSLGILLYQLLAGRLPFPLTAEGAIHFHLYEEPSWEFLQKHPWRKTLETILRRLLDKNPARRPQDALEVLTALNEGEGTTFEVHRGWQKTAEESLFFQKIQDYLEGLNRLLDLPTVTAPRSFLEEELSRIRKYTACTEGLAPESAQEWRDRLAETEARILIQQGRYDEAVKIAGDSDALRNMTALAEIYRENYAKAKRILSEISKKGKRPVDRARAKNYLGIAAYNQGRNKESIPLFRESLEAMRRLGETTGIVSNAMNLAAALQDEEQVGEALRIYKEALSAATSLHNSYLLAILLANIANLHLSIGALQEAEGSLECSGKLAAELRLPLLQGYGLLLAADLAMWRRDFEGADQLLVEAAQTFQPFEAGTHLAMTAINRAENAFRARHGDDLPGRIAEAEAALRKTRLPEARFRLEILKLQSQIARSENLKEASQRLEELKRLASKRKEKFQVVATRAQLQLVQRDFEACEGSLSELRELFEEEQRSVPIASRARLGDAPRFALFWEVEEEWKRLQEAPADRSLWKLVAINKRIARQRNPESLYGLILDTAIELTGAERGFLILPEYGKWKRGTWKVQAARHFHREDLPGGRERLSQTIVDRILKSEKPLLVHNAQEEEAFRCFQSVQSLRLLSILAAPIIVFGEMAGILYLDHARTAHLFEEKDLKILKAFADQAGIAIANSRQYYESLRRQKNLDAMRLKLEETNRQLQEELQRKSLWAEQVEEELKRVQMAGPLVARSSRMRHLAKQIPTLAGLRKPVVLTGELGTGKHLMARLLHDAAGTGTFIQHTAVSLPRQKTSAEGTDALLKIFEEARGGTLCLDEIADLPVAYQKELLRLLRAQDELGDQRVFVILSSQSALKELKDKGILIPELYRTLAGAELEIPPLRKRKEDIAPLVRHFLHEISQTRGIKREVSRSALAILHEQDWPGNVRELRLEIERAALASQTQILPSDLSPNLLKNVAASPHEAGQKAEFRNRRAQFERDCILQALERTGWNKVRTAKRLGIPRSLLYLKIQKYRIPLK